MSISSIESTSGKVTVPSEIVDAEGVTHPVTAISEGMFDKSVKGITLGENTKKIEKNALKGLKKLKNITCTAGTKFQKGSLSGTSKKLTITILMLKESTKKERRKAKKAAENQLKKAGNTDAKVKIVVED